MSNLPTSQPIHPPLLGGGVLRFELVLTTEAQKTLATLKVSNYKKLQKVTKTLKTIANNLRQPGLKTHKFKSQPRSKMKKMFEAYVENKTPGAWRVFWSYGPGARVITVHAITPHP